MTGNLWKCLENRQKCLQCQGHGRAPDQTFNFESEKCQKLSNCRSSLSFIVSAEQYEVAAHQSEQRIPVRQSGRPTRFQNGIPVKIGGDRTNIE